MLLLTHIYNMPFTEVCMFIGSLDKSDKGGDWWWSLLKTADAQNFLSPPMQTTLHPPALHFLCSPSATWQWE